MAKLLRKRCKSALQNHKKKSFVILAQLLQSNAPILLPRHAATQGGRIRLFRRADRSHCVALQAIEYRRRLLLYCIISVTSMSTTKPTQENLDESLIAP
jgi:hypothetical protein